MLFIPVLLIIFTGALFRDHYENGSDGNQFSSAFLSELYAAMSEEPERLLSEGYLIKLSMLSGYNDVSISVHRGGNEAAASKSVSKHSGYGRFASSWKFYFSDGEAGSLSVFIRERGMMKGAFPLGGLFMVLVIVVLILTNGILSYLVAGSILRPLYLLKDAALRIKNEDLDSPVVYAGDDEFADVCRTFEEMRVRLKDSLHEQLKAEENRKELLSSISHDLKTPITTIKGYVEGIRDGIADSPEKMEKYINTVYTKSVLMNELIDRLFLFSKLDLNRVQFNFQAIELGSFLRDICEELRYDYPELEIRFDGGGENQVMADSLHLHRVVANIVDNAVKYRSELLPVVRIALSAGNGRVSVIVEDNGRGIADEDLAMVFERFYRSDPARSSEVEGSGLGLAISKQIITAHGGNMSAESEKGRGTTITFTLRAAE
jgi:histidine kinase